MTYDIVVVGGGPAGATLARLLGGRTKKILLLEKNSSSSALGKVCGGLLAPDAVKELKKQSIVLPEVVFVSPQLQTVKAYDAMKHCQRDYPRCYQNIDRMKFDAHLIGLIDPEVDIWYDAVFKSYTDYSDHLELTVFKAGQHEVISTKFLVSAEGFGSLIRSSVTQGKDKIRKYICLQEWVNTEAKIPYHMAHFHSKVTDYYSWAIPKEELLILGSALAFGPEARSRFQTFKDQVKPMLAFDPVPKWTESHGLYRPKRLCDFVLGDKNVYLIGEAAGLVSPSSGEGISYALKSARILAKAMLRSPNMIGRVYRRNTFPMRIRIWIKNLKSLVIYTPFLRRIVMWTGITARKD